MRNKRKVTRKSPNEGIEIHDANSSLLIGHLANLSTEGLMLVGKMPIAPSTLFQLRLSLPSAVHGTKAVEFGAESLWCQRAGGLNKYWTGLQIIDISRQTTDIIEHITRDWRECR